MKIIFMSVLFFCTSVFAQSTPPGDEIDERIQANFDWVNARANQRDFVPKRADESAIVKVQLVDADGTFRVFGFSEQEILKMNGDDHGGACSPRHNHDDIANRWCHASIVKVVDAALRSIGVPPLIAASAAASIFVFKEYAYDLHPSHADLVAVADQNIYSSDDLNISFTLFGDGSPFIVLRKRF